MIDLLRSPAGAAIASLAALTLAGTARAQSVDLSVAPGSSIETTVTVTTVFGSDSDGPVVSAVTGTAEAQLSTTVEASHGLVADSLQITASDLGFADSSFELVIPPLAPIEIALVGIRGAFDDTLLAPGTAVAANTASFDLTPFAMQFTEGEFVVTDPPGIPADGTFFDLQGDAVVTTVANGADLDVTIQIPIVQTASTTESGVTVDVAIDGTVVLQGTGTVTPVPSLGPAGLAALALGLLGLAARRCLPDDGSGRPVAPRSA